MISRWQILHSVVGVFAAAALLCIPAFAATKNVDLDGNSSNGAESQCDLNVLETFPVKIENKVTNKASGDAYTFSWPSAGPGGFTSSVTPGTTGGVGAKWTWTTNQTVYSYTGSTCDKDICFAQTEGPDSIARFCSYACLSDATTLTISKGATAGNVNLSWTGGTATFTIYRSTNKVGVVDPANAIGTTDTTSFTDTPPSGTTVFYAVRGTDCNQRKSCQSDADCSSPGDGTCVSRGPFGVPGRSLYTNDVTVSSASLTSSLITFFSPPKEIFRITSTANAGGFIEERSNFSTAAATVTTPAYPPGCCPANPDVPHQLRCPGGCVDYLNDPNNCGACGNVCGEGTCCSNGNCVSLCQEGQTWCNGQCVDFQNDNANCGGCGNACGDGTCCNGGACGSICRESETYCGEGECADFQNDNNDCGACGTTCSDGTCCSDGGCASLCSEGRTWCGNKCADFQSDPNNCGACGNICGEGTCCSGGVCASVCGAGQVWCNGQCADVQDDSNNCGACGNVCGEGTCCSGGVCASVCGAGQVWCNGQCVDFQNDSANCGACGNVCGEGTCCSAGVCASVCDAGQVWCNGQCVDFQNDTNNCGACGNVCGAGTCCSAGVCASTCSDGRTYCNGLCYDTQNDPGNCGGCGNVCPEDSVCSGGACQPCTGQGGKKDACDNRCVNLNTDPYNCGACGHSCNLDCPSGFTGVCSNGQSCRCEAGTPAPQPPSNIPPPEAPVCPNPHPSGPVPGVCPNPTPTHPAAGVCPNPDPSSGPVPGVCPNPVQSTPVGGVCPNPDLTYGPVAGVCPNSSPTFPVAGVCPNPGPPAPPVNETPTCVVNESTSTIPPGGSSTNCYQGGVLFKEVQTAVVVCGDGIPGVNGECNNATTRVTTGSFNRLVPDETKSVGNAYVTPYAVHITDTSGDGMLQPGESASLVIDVVNAGPVNITGANATLAAPEVDLTQDEINNPVAITIGTASSPYGTIAGTPISTNCTAPPPHPASNTTAFTITVPTDHPGDTSRPFNLALTGTVGESPFSMNVPLALGIADRCVFTALTRDFDGVDGLSTPMAKLVPTGDPIPMPDKPFSAGKTRPLKLRTSCGGVNQTGNDVDPPEIVGLSEATRGPLDIGSLNLNSDNSTNPNDPFFRYNTSQGGQWIYNMRTSLLGTGTFTLKIRIAGRKEYVTGFVLE